MRVRDSGMPDEPYWESLFDVRLILSKLGIDQFHDVAEFGCGYGTFTVPVAQAIGGAVHAFDIDPQMIARTAARSAGLAVRCHTVDVLEAGFGVEVDAVLLFNILHCERPIELLQRAAQALRPKGQILVIHWRYGQTPRGPELGIRPRPEEVVAWAHSAGLSPSGESVDLPPWHYGLKFGLASTDDRRSLA
jgi:SAM-dependent methyltransferase